MKMECVMCNIDARKQCCIVRTTNSLQNIHDFTALTSSGVECPLKGKYQVTSGERSCRGRLISGCNRYQQMNIKCGPLHSSDTCK